VDTKKIFFLVGLPRAGNTLFSSIMNQNPDVAVTANSITADTMNQLFQLKYLNIFKNYPDHKSLDNLAYHVFDLYYKDWNCKYIIDRAPWSTPSNLKMLKETQKDIKIIVLVRDIIEVLASYIRWSHGRTDTFIDRYNVKTIEEKCEKLMEEIIITKNLLAINHLFLPEYKDLYLLIEYNNLVEHPKKTIEKVYDFLEIPKFKHRYTNLDQFEVNGRRYDDIAGGVEGFHTIKSDSISKSSYDAYSLIPKGIIEKYRKLNCWKK